MSRRWNRKLQCRLDAIEVDLETHTVYLAVPEMECTDMDGAIAFARQHDPDVQRVDVYSGEQPDTAYLLEGETWKAYRMRWREQ